jgi:hypothetical protein
MLDSVGLRFLLEYTSASISGCTSRAQSTTTRMCSCSAVNGDWPNSLEKVLPLDI